MSHAARFLPMVLLVLFLGACAGGKEAKRPPNPHIMSLGQSVAINTFTLDQSDFPLFSGSSALSRPPRYLLPDKPETRDHLRRLFTEAGFHLVPDYPFHYAKIHVRLDGYDREQGVGFLFVDEGDFEVPRPGSRPLPGGVSLFNTEPSPERISGSELLLFEQLNQAELVYIALINAHQFAWLAEDGEAGRQAALENLTARVGLYLQWVKARKALHNPNNAPVSSPQVAK